MHHYSSSYVYNKSNYVLVNVEHPYKENQLLFPYYCVVQNLIQRGTPTKPSQTLTRSLGAAADALDDEKVILHDYTPKWDTAIKGAEDRADNPAHEFFYKILPQYLSEDRRYIVQYILPEAKIGNIIDNCDAAFYEQEVDFYCPRAALIIEIDGKQHTVEPQRTLDQKRDDYLRQKGIDTIRITANEVRTQSRKVIDAINQLEEKLINDVPPVIWHNVAKVPKWQQVAAYEAAMRIEILIIELLKQGVLNIDMPEWVFNLTDDGILCDAETVFRVAFEDLYAWLQNLCKLNCITLTQPKILFSRETNALSIDLSVVKMWSPAEINDKGTIYIRNDYYEAKDYFEVSIAPAIAYQTTSENNENNIRSGLLFFLEALFGYDVFNSGQIGIIRKALARNATLGILPTGSGKSLCYQMACLLQPCISFIVCPLLSLIQDQKDNLDSFSITRTAKIDSSIEWSEKAQTESAFGRGKLQMVWISPERFQSQSFRNDLKKISGKKYFGYAVIDEVHCLSEWGHDFRVSYLTLPRAIKKYCPGAVLLGLTATASTNVFVDLLVELDITKENVQAATTLDRPELKFHITKTNKKHRADQLYSILSSLNAKYASKNTEESIFTPRGEKSICGIVFANTRYSRDKESGCDNIQNHLKEKGIDAGVFYAPKNLNEVDIRPAIQHQYLHNEFTLMVATKAFGMGINKKNIRYTIHYGLPWSIESFYQEAGRAGRDKRDNASDCYILFDPDPNTKRVERLFSLNTTIEEIHEIQRELAGDLNTLFFLWGRNYDGIKKEAEAIVEVFKALKPTDMHMGTARIPMKTVPNTEKALYKLAIMGVIKDWTCDYNNGSYEVELGEVTEPSVKASIEKYINRHSGHFSFDSAVPAHSSYVKAYKSYPVGQKFKGLILALLRWENDNIVYNRRAAIGNILRLCESDQSDEAIREYINAYFKVDTTDNDQIEAIILSKADIMPWINIFYIYDSVHDPLNVSKSLRGDLDLRGISALCDRYRESYHNNIGLEWVNAIAKLLTNTFVPAEVDDQVSFLLSELEKTPAIDSEALFEETLTLLQRSSDEAQESFGGAIVKHNPDLAQKVYARLGDIVTLEFLVTTAANELNSVWGGARNA